jgi:glycolate oxidase FAD binding subunit
MGMSEIAARLSEALKGDGKIQPWAAVDVQRQQAIMSAMSPSSPPACLALPSTATELSQIMAIASTHNWRVLPMGQGSKLSWGGLAEGIDIVISTARLNRLVEHAVGDFTVTVEPGLKVADLQRMLAEQRQFLAVDPAFAERATVGGLVATADTGSLRQRYGGLRDMLIGIQFARYDGELARAGGRVVKNVAGYDLMKLLTGSYGSLGILSELTFRLYPMQAYSRSLILSGPSLAIEAATAEIRLSGLTPVALDVLSESLTEKLSLRYNQTEPEAERSRSLVARFQGIEAGVEEQTARLKKIAMTHGMGVVQLEGAADENFWQQSAQVLQADTLLCKVGLRPSGIPWLIELADKAMPGAQVRLYGSSGLGWIQVDIAEMAAASVVSGLEELRSHCQKNAGFLTLLQAPKTIKQSVDVWGYSGNALTVMSDIKQKFDPQRRLSPGRFVGQL